MFRLYKKEKLCSTIAIEQLFAGATDSCLCYPLRAVWREHGDRSSDAPVQFLVSVPKRRLRHAVDRVKMRRRVREAYRLNRGAYAIADGRRYDLAFIYVASGLTPYAKVERAVCRILQRLSDASSQSSPSADDTPPTDIHPAGA